MRSDQDVAQLFELAAAMLRRQEQVSPRRVIFGTRRPDSPTMHRECVIVRTAPAQARAHLTRIWIDHAESWDLNELRIGPRLIASHVPASSFHGPDRFDFDETIEIGEQIEIIAENRACCALIFEAGFEGLEQP